MAPKIENQKNTPRSEDAFQRILEADDVPEPVKEGLRIEMSQLNPRQLRKKLRQRTVDFWGYRGKKDHQLTKYAV